MIRIGEPLILVTDDDPDLRGMLRTRLTKAGFRVITASGRDSCRDSVFSFKPDLLILDICLPEPLAGTELYDELLDAGLPVSVPVIFISALEDEGLPPRLSSDGGKIALFGKPFCFETLLGEIRKLLGMPALREPAAALG